jgi:hypothetical protein
MNEARLIESMKECLEHAMGKRKLKTTRINPKRIDKKTKKK